MKTLQDASKDLRDAFDEFQAEVLKPLRELKDRIRACYHVLAGHGVMYGITMEHEGWFDFPQQKGMVERNIFIRNIPESKD